ncbi:MAG: hypothetical protein FWD44_00230 [Oscillospiraceae bacterium]|nr:hypothetical protein [Oscillospiraceae bacterium]
MKKLAVTIVLALILCVSFALPAFSSGDGSSFDTAIPLNVFGNAKRDQSMDDFGPVTGTFADREQFIYYTFTTSGEGYYTIRRDAQSAAIKVYDSNRNEIHDAAGSSTINIELKANSKYYFTITSVATENSFERENYRTFRLAVGDISGDAEKWSVGGIWSFIIFFGIPLGFAAVVFFPYRKYMIRTYEFNPIGKSFLFSMGLVIVCFLLHFFKLGDIFMKPWFIGIVMLPGFLIMTLSLLKKTRNMVVILINTGLMAIFYIIMAVAAIMLFMIFATIVVLAFIIMVAGKTMTMKSGGGGPTNCPSCQGPAGPYSGGKCSNCVDF